MNGPDLPEVPTSDQPGADDTSSNLEEEAPPPQSKNYYTEAYPGAAWTYGKGPMFMNDFDEDKHAATYVRR